MFEELNDGHVIKTMFTEHEHILCILNEIQDLGEQLSDKNKSENKNLLQQINQLSLQLISAEPHHQREEDVLFPTLETRGIIGPPQVMKQEHGLIRNLKHQLKKKTVGFGNNWKGQVNSLSYLIIELCDTLRQHIHKENHILYPMAIQAITEDSQWDKMKIKCDEIGYCCFCPNDNQIIHPENNSKSIVGKCE
ncbi:MAG: hemerythrin domain-containing protein [Candidatus Marinimicrobia bacterium]|nr:hemerythrin domain-containing protein [Candidatus Neomarinimicrobiota bacterium]